MMVDGGGCGGDATGRVGVKPPRHEQILLHLNISAIPLLHFVLMLIDLSSIPHPFPCTAHRDVPGEK